MSVLIYDSETTGLPLYGKDNPSDAPYQPRMCALAMALVADDGEVIAKKSALVKPDGWPLDDEKFMGNLAGAEKIHGLTLERLQAEGVPIADLHILWQELYAEAEATCGFNTWFDHKVVRGEWKRLGHPIPFRDKPGICLMKAARPLCGLPKNPKLGEAVRILLGAEIKGAHTADGDLDATIDLYRFLKQDHILVREEQPEAKQQ